MFVFSQTLDYESITTSKPLKVSGVISANGVYYNSNLNNSRIPFTYFLQGTLNVNLYSFSMPISYSFSNQGENLGYNLPFDFNRISLHPKYKWITGHIGSVSMSFSPYTLNGHQFTGGGLDLALPGAFKISVMSGRLLKATEDDGKPNTITAFDRMGYGFKTGYETDKFRLGLIGFYAKDELNSLPFVPEERGVLPKENLVVSFEGDIKITQSLSVQAEYASSAITQDLRAVESDDGKVGVAGLIFNNRASTEYYNALRTGFNYAINRVNVGLLYERIDPGYETLGAYFFNNDFENITLNASSTFFKNKLSLLFNIGYQRDDLKNQKANSTNRTVGAVNATLALNEKINIAGSYSNFSTFTNIKPNQFDEINDDNLLDEELEDLNFNQLSQTATLSINWILKNEKHSTQNLNFNYALNDIANEQGGIVRIGDASTFHNFNSAYNIGFPNRSIDVITAVNYTYNTIGREDATTWGPTLSIGKRFFDRILNTRLASSYNISNGLSEKTEVLNFRFNTSYIYKDQHNFNLNAIQLFRESGENPKLNELTVTFGYNYAFGIKKPKFNRKDKSHIRFTYRKKVFEGTTSQITEQVMKLAAANGIQKMIRKKRSDLGILEIAMKITENKPEKVYKETAIEYLESLYNYLDFLEKYDELVELAHEKLILEGEKADYDIKKEYLSIHARINSSEKPDPIDIEEAKIIEKKHDAHRRMLSEIRKVDINNIEDINSDLKGFKKKYFSKVYVMFENGKSEKSIINYIEVRMANVYHKLLSD